MSKPTFHSEFTKKLPLFAAAASFLIIGACKSPGAANSSSGEVAAGKATDNRVDSAVEAHLRWLARHQSADGSWSPDHYDQQCATPGECTGKGYPEHQVGVTALATLAFLGAGYDERSTKEFTEKGSNRKYHIGETVKNALKWLREHQDESGSFVSSNNSKWGYNHGIATLAMCEAYGLTRAPQLKNSAQRAINCLLNGQNKTENRSFGGWRYRPASGDSDISVTGWCTLALRSGQLAGLNVPKDSVDAAYAFVREVTEERNGHVGYTKREEAGMQVKAVGKNDDYQNHPSLAAIGMCVRVMTQSDRKDPLLSKVSQLLANDPPQWNKATKANDYYYWYFGTLALTIYNSPGGDGAPDADAFKKWQTGIKQSLLDHQFNSPKKCNDGSWDADDRWSFEGGKVFVTALNGLTFETYYRYNNSQARQK